MSHTELADLSEHGQRFYQDMAEAYDIADTVLPPSLASDVRAQLDARLRLDWRCFGQVDTLLTNQLQPLVRDVLGMRATQAPECERARDALVNLSALADRYAVSARDLLNAADSRHADAEEQTRGRVYGEVASEIRDIIIATGDAVAGSVRQLAAEQARLIVAIEQLSRAEHALRSALRPRRDEIEPCRPKWRG